MTEQEWLESTDPRAMLEFLDGKASERKLRLFACACCRRIWCRLGKVKAPAAVDVSEAFADGRVGKREMRKVLSRLGAMGGISAAWAANCAEFAVLENSAGCAATQAVRDALFFAHHFKYEQTFSTSTFTGDHKIAAEAGGAERIELAGMVREFFGNPFAILIVDPSWLTPAVVKLAEAVYEERAFDRFPAFADALDEAGCHDADLLNHCRKPGVHVRGCWVLDLLLGKE